MAIADTPHATFAEKLRNPLCPFDDIVVELGLGHLDLPDVLASPTRRWAWFADLLDHHGWGLATEVPALAALCETAARLSRRTATAGGATDALTAQWRSLVQSVAVVSGSDQSVGQAEALALLSELAVDGLDYCSGKVVSGFEALLEYIAAVRAVDGPTARQRLIRSTEWEPDLCSGQLDSATG
ncbi:MULTISPECIES: hypothetical protein [Nocardiaceae]|uniref:hypothetical protein n=1 Tax=Nocardiaceae TaxID=85025 RepID=UPI00070F2551|nr:MULTISPECIES: hypothetical protein [Rhodococcus]KQU35710.1 hypothetical protein ASH04_23850 [Rhodococcus sp. Leaf233]MBP2527462.1 hypothetical protein [Rhodococcus sp. PvP104]WQH31318.1 hypothetical protein U2G91_26295 [Rhodococcus fascians]